MVDACGARRPSERRRWLLTVSWIAASTFLSDSFHVSNAFSLGSPRECTFPFPRCSSHVVASVAKAPVSRPIRECRRTTLVVKATQGDYDVDDLAESTPTSTTSLSTPLDRPLLAAVDAAALLVFASIGRASHGTGDVGGSVSGALQTLGTALPFLVAWLATSPLTGVYKFKERRNDNDDDNQEQSRGNLIRDTVLQTVPGWAVAVPLGCVLRGVVRGYAPPLPFVIVAMIATLVLLCSGRVAFSVIEDFFVELV